MKLQEMIAAVQAVPVFELMGIFSLVGFADNSACLYLLWQKRSILISWLVTVSN